MRPSNMGIPVAATISSDPVTPPTGREVPSSAQARQPGTPIGGEHSIPVPSTSRMAPRDLTQQSTHADDDSTPPSQLRRINEGGDAIPGSQDAALALQTEHQLRISGPVGVVPATLGMRRSRQQMNAETNQRQWEGLQCCMCAGADAFQAQDSRGLLLHLVRGHLGQVLTAEAIAQLRALDKVACQDLRINPCAHRAFLSVLSLHYSNSASSAWGRCPRSPTPRTVILERKC